MELSPRDGSGMERASSDAMLDSNCEAVRAALGTGRENARTREALCGVTGLSDRVLREAIEHLQREGVFVVNMQDGAGYYIAENHDELYRWYRLVTAHALSTLTKRKPVRDYLKGKGYKV